MVLRVFAYLFNAGLLGLGLLNLIGGGICAAIVALGAGVFNLVALIRRDTGDGTLKMIGLFCNGVAIIYGLVVAVQAWGMFSGHDLPENAPAAAGAIAGTVAVAVAICLLGAGAITLAVFIREEQP